MRNGSFRFDVSICEMSKDPTTESAQVVKADADVMAYGGIIASRAALGHAENVLDLLQKMDASGVAG